MKSAQNLIILDSNFILLPFQFKIDYLHEIRELIEGELKFIIFQQVLNELEAKKRREPKATKFRRFLESGLLYLERSNDKYPIEIIEEVKNNNETTDDFLLKSCCDLKNESRHIFLATNDSELRRKTKDQNLGVFFLRQKRYISIERA